MRIYDITVPLGAGLPAYPGDPRVEVEPLLLLSRGDGADVSRITLTDHSGTHIDAPGHMLPGGTAVEGVPLSLLMGRALVADLRGAGEIGPAELARLPLAGEERLLLKTDNSSLWAMPDFSRDHVALTEAGADFLVRAGIGLAGIDYLSIERFGGGGSVHRRLLAAGVVILEGLDLSAVTEGIYELICLPLRLPGAGGAPARAVLRRF